MTLALAHLLVAYVVLIMPWIGRYKYRRFQQQLSAGAKEARLRFYRLGVGQQWLLVAIILVFTRFASLPLRVMGLASPYSWNTAGSLLITFAIAIGASVILFRWTGDRFLRRLLKMAGALSPATAPERLWFAAICLGAGVSEELLFRGFFLWYLNLYLPRLDLMQLIVFSSLIFGFCHVYQGWMGVLGTGALGAILAWMYLSTGSLMLPMTIHTLIDLRILAIFTPGRMRSLQLSPNLHAPQPEKADPSTSQTHSF